MTLVSALTNAGSVMQHTDTQYLSREFAITSDAAQKASSESLVVDLQTIFHRCKEEADRLNTAKKILITLGIIASKQGTPEEQARFVKIKAITLQALSPEGQTNDKASRAEYFQSKLSLLLYAKKIMISQGVEAHTGLSHMDSLAKVLEAFEGQPAREDDKQEESYTYRGPEDLSTLALSMHFRIESLSMIDCGEHRLLTREELLELESYCQHEDPQVKKIANDYAILRKTRAAWKLRSKSKKDAYRILKIGITNMLIIEKNELFEPSQTLSIYYPAFDKYVNFQNNSDNMEPSVMFTIQKGFYEEHLTQLPDVHFAYRYFYNELMEVCSLFSNRVAAASYKKAYADNEEPLLPSPDSFQAIEAVFPEPIFLSLPSVEEEKKEAPLKKPPASSKKSRPSKSKKQPPPKQKVQTTTKSPRADTAQEKAAGNLRRDILPFDEIVYDPRVSLWFTNPEDCLSLPSYVELGEKVKEIVVYKHAFPNAFDQLLGTAYSLQETYQSSTRKQADILFSIPGEIECIGSSKKTRGLFQYCFGAKDKVCYHHCFKEMSTRDLIKIDQYAKTFEEAEFPPLSSQRLAPAMPRTVYADQELVYEPQLNTYAVKDGSKGLIFRAFKIRDLV